MFRNDGMIIGMLRRRIEKYKEIVKRLLNSEELTEAQKEFLIKEKILE